MAVAVADIVNMDSVHPFGPPGASASFVHGLTKPDKPMGEPPRKDTASDNDLINDQRYGR